MNILGARYVEYAFLATLVLISCIGWWHAFPLVNVIADEQYYVGGSLRALEAKSLVPLMGDVPYGTVTFYLTYALMLPFLAVMFLVSHGSVDMLRQTLVLAPELAYLVPRVVSVVIAVAFAWFLNRFLKEERVSLTARLASLSTLFMTALPLVIFHTGKMWVLSFVAVAVAILYAYRSIRKAREGDDAGACRALYPCGAAAAIASGNFLFAGIAYLCVPILIAYLPRTRTYLRAGVRALLLSVALLAVVFLLNGENIVSLVALVFSDYHPLVGATKLSFLESFNLHAVQAVSAYPLALALIAIALFRRNLEHTLLFIVSILFAGAYLVVLSFLATWYADPGLYLRYMFPFGFFLALAVAAFSFERLHLPAFAFIGMQCVVCAYTLMLLSVPTTYNLARTYVINEYRSEQALVYEDVVELDLPMNSETARTTQEQFCGSKCAYLRTHELSTFTPVTESWQSTPDAIAPSAYAHRYVIIDTPSLACGESPIASFVGGGRDDHPVTIERNLGSYFAPDFWRLMRLGQNLYLYKVSPECYDFVRSQAAQKRVAI
ncbi:MAG: hypothetical protein ABA06_04690 [Parcubacteria bacterium C7867-001]|nr:MAG: hypothetical protein ABA06_04690 [Parcubacteria bacterium C7867-001]